VQSGVAKAAENVEKRDSTIPRTPRHGKSIASHTKHTLALLNEDTPKKKHAKAMVQKLAIAAAEAAAQVVVLQQELDYLRQKNKAATDSLKVHSRKVLSKALVVTAEEVVRLREKWEEREKKKAEKAATKAAAALRASDKSTTVPSKTTLKSATNTGKPRGRPKKKVTLVPKVVVLELDEDSECQWEEVDEVYSDDNDEFIPIYTPPRSRKVKEYVVRQRDESTGESSGGRTLRSRK
jgi:hypothetical protein